MTCVRCFGRRDHGSAGRHGVPDEERRLTQLVDEREDVAGQGDVVVGAEGGVAVSVAAEVQGHHPAALLDEEGRQQAVALPELTHSRHADHQRAAGAGHLVGKPSLGTLQLL